MVVAEHRRSKDMKVGMPQMEHRSHVKTLSFAKVTWKADCLYISCRGCAAFKKHKFRALFLLNKLTLMQFICFSIEGTKKRSVG